MHENLIDVLYIQFLWLEMLDQDYHEEKTGALWNTKYFDSIWMDEWMNEMNSQEKINSKIKKSCCEICWISMKINWVS